MAFLDEIYPEPSETSEARHTLHFVAWLDLAFTLLFVFTVLLTLGESNSWIALFQLPHIWVWALAIGVAEARDGAFVISFGFTTFVLASVLDFVAVLVRLFLEIFEADATPWIHIFLLLETLVLLTTSLIVLLSAQSLRTSLARRDAAARAKHAQLTAASPPSSNESQQLASTMIETKTSGGWARKPQGPATISIEDAVD